MNAKIYIKISSYDFRLLDLWVMKIVNIIKSQAANVQGPIPLPMKKELFTLQKSPHVNKPSMEQYERRTHKRLIVFSNFKPDLITTIQKLTLPSSLEVNFKIK